MKISLPSLAFACLLLLPSCTSAQHVATIQEKAARGDPHAEAVLGEMYAKGSEVPQSYAQAAAWWTKAAAAGNAQAAYNLGVLYEHGQGVARSDADAGAWYTRAALKGMPAAEYNLGVFYEQGRGEPKDMTQAARWYLKAAQQGHPDAQFNIGAIYARNHQPEDAYFWLSVAAKNGDHEAQTLRDDLGAKMSPSQTADITRRVNSWRPAAG
jgi:uncharacterized protein